MRAARQWILIPAMLLAAVAMGGLGWCAAGTAAEYHGNVQSHVFHKSTCKYYDCKNCSESFDTAQAALDAGYKPCGTCKPASTTATKVDAGGCVGNTKSHIFHKATCHNAGCKSCGVRFSSRDQAMKAGYKPGGCCHP